jgi:CubicO group peptidase (beta-lactamase class C family)
MKVRLTSKVKILLSGVIAALMLATSVLAQERLDIDPAQDATRIAQLASGQLDAKTAQIVTFRNWRILNPARKITASEQVLALPYQLEDFSALRYQVAGSEYSLDDYLDRNPTAGLLVIKDGEIRYEHYGLGNTEETLWVSFSMSKSVTSMLLGAAIQDGYITSIDDNVSAYLPLLRNSAYDTATIRNVLQMASGVQWNENYEDPQADVFNYPAMDVPAMLTFLGSKPRDAAPGDKFNYNTGETDLVGAVVRAAIGNNLSDYLQNKVWQPFGMEHDAWWATHGQGGERGGCCLNASLRDYGRIGLFALRSGELPDGTAMLPEQWMSESTSPSSAFAGYGYLWWLSGNGPYEARGIYGQGIYINPETQVVIVLLSAWDQAGASGNPSQPHRAALYQAINDALNN